MAYTVKAVATLAGISVRTLHHYDEIGLLKPASTSPAGYRLYSDADLERLQQILFFRELGFELKEIKTIIERPDFDRKHALASHRQILIEKQKRLNTLIRSVDRTLEALERGTTMANKDMFEGFDEAQIKAWQNEARQRWGSEHVDESVRRYAKLSKAEQAAIQAETMALNQAIAVHVGGDPGHPEVQSAVARWHQLINTAYYDCSLEIFRGLGDLYVDDARFTATYEAIKPGLAPFLRDAMRLYCDRQTAKA